MRKKLQKLRKCKRVCGGNFTINSDVIVGGDCYQQKSIC